MASFSIIDCCEQHGARRERIDSGACQCSTTLICDWEDRFALAQDLVANRRAWPALSAFANPPRCRSAEIVSDESAYTADGQEVAYTEPFAALVSVEYDNTIPEPEDDEDSPELILNESLEPNQEFITLDYRKFRWDNAAGDPLLEAEAPGRPLHSLNLVRRFQRWEPPLPIELISMIGHVNDEPYISARLGLTFAEKTLLYMPAPLNHDVTTAGSQAWQGELKFAYKPEGWDKFWRASKNAWAQIYSTDVAALYVHFPEGDLSPLLF